MRKLLLASAAVIGGFAGGQAMAQTAATAPLPPTWTEAPQPTAPSGIAAANTNLSAQGFYTKGPLPAPTPGSIVVRFNGRVVFYGYALSQTGDSVTASVTTYSINQSTGAITKSTAGSGTYKIQPYGTLGYARFYQGVDGMTTSGLRYGAAAEIRVQTSFNAGASATSGGASGSNIGSGNIYQVTPGSTAINYTPGNYLYVRRAFAYLGGDWGAIHLGQDDGPTGLLDAGVTTFQTYNDGGWNDDLNDIGNATTPLFPFPSGIGNEYTTSKVVYMSPQIAGFDFMASFEPDDNTLGDSLSPGSAIATTNTISTGSLPFLVARRRNTVEVGGRYQGSFGPAGIYAFASYMGSGKVAPGAAGLPAYDGLSAFFGGLAVNFGGLRVGGSVLTGQMNNQVALKPEGAPNMNAYLLGAQYTMGPLTVGASWLDVWSAGAWSPVVQSTRHEWGLNVGGTYVLAPGLLGWLSATYGQRYQGGVNFIGVGSASDFNNVVFRAIALGGMVRW